jgi:periplasmic protein CpxP/Spy
MKKRLVCGAAVVLLLLFSAAYAAGDREEMYKDLGLTAEQQAKMKELREQGREKARALFAQQKEVMEKLRAELEKPGATRESVRELVAQAKALHAQGLELRLDRVFQLKEVLTAEQYEKFQKKIKEKAGKFRGRRSKRGMGSGEGQGPGDGPPPMD